MGLDESGLPSGKGQPAGLDPGEYLIDLSLVGDDELQASEIEFLENGVECWGRRTIALLEHTKYSLAWCHNFPILEASAGGGARIPCLAASP